jgi:FkbM family methyltransferase
MPIPKTLRSLRAVVARSRGVPSEPVCSPCNARYDEWSAEIIRRVLGPDDVALDVGANEGSILSALVNQAPGGAHHAFEPIPSLAARLRERFPHVRVHELALSDENGQSEFHHVVTNPSYSGLRRRRYDRPGERVELIRVETARLDDVLPLDTVVRLVKIDVEGGELGVLRGGVKLLSACRPYILFEHGLGAADFYQTRPEEIYDLLTVDIGLGSINLLDRWLEARSPLSRQDFVDEFESNRNFFFLAAPE